MIVTRFKSNALAAPMVGSLLLFLGFPAALTLVYSVSDVTFQTIRTPHLSGLGNYAEVFQDPDFWSAAWFSLRFGALTAAAESLLGLALAIFLAPLLEKRPPLMALLMLPMMVAPAMVGLMYRLVLHEFVGPIPYYLYQMFGDSPAFLSGDTAFWTLVVVETLQWTPFALLLFYMAYEAVPQEVRQAASIDGAGGWKMLTLIDLPIMAPTILIGLILRFIDGFRVFDNVYTLTGSGAGGATTSMSIYIYQSFFREGDIGKAVSASVLLFVCFFVILYALNRLSQRKAM